MRTLNHTFISPIPNLNHTFISLIPKNQKVHEVKHFHPIALCNLIYKIITKILAGVIKPLMEAIMSPS